MVRVMRATGKHRPGQAAHLASLVYRNCLPSFSAATGSFTTNSAGKKSNWTRAQSFLASFTRLRFLPSGPCRTSSPQAPPGCAARPWSGPEGPALCLQQDALPPLLPLSEHPPSGCRHPGRKSPEGASSERRAWTVERGGGAVIGRTTWWCRASPSSYFLYFCLPPAPEHASRGRTALLLADFITHTRASKPTLYVYI